MKHIRFFLILCLIFLGVVFTTAQVVINEFSCSNYSANADNFGEYEDFIELYNTGSSVADISGYHLSDNDNNPDKWAFPAGTTIPAGGFLRVWCSGKDVVNGGNMHSNFKLTQNKPNPEYVVFADPAATVLESYNLHNFITQTNHSNGRTTNGAATWSVFTTPTPGASNNTTAYERYATKPVFGINGGFYSGAQTVSITTTEPNAQIRYTTNGNMPDATSTLYTAPLNVSATTIVMARVYSSNTQILPSLYEFNTYFINVNHSIPVVSIAGTNVSNLLNGNSSNPQGCVEYFEGGSLKTKVTGEFNKHGNDSWAYAQRGIDFVSRDHFGYGDALRHQIFASSQRSSFQRVMFKPAANDNVSFEDGAHIRDAYIHTLAERAGMELDGRRYEPCILYLNGQYWGVYETREKADDHDFTSYYYDQDEFDLYYLKTWGGTWSEYGGNAAQTDWDNLRNYIQNNNMGVAANYNYVQDRLNFLSLIDYFIINTHTVCMDWLNWNTAWWRGTDSSGQQLKWRYVLWDMDATFGHYINYTGVPDTGPNADPCFGENLPNPGGQGHTSIMKKLVDESPEFKQLYMSRYVQLLNTTLSCDSMIAILDELIIRIQPEMQGQLTRWGGNYNTWLNNVQAIRDFMLQRCQIINQGLVDCYNLTGPFDVVFDVAPVGGGFIGLNGAQIPTYPATSTFFGGIQNTLTATANPGFQFSHWEIIHNTLLPNTSSQQVDVSFASTDTVIAHFTQVASPKTLTVIVVPPGSGTVDVNGFTPTVYPWQGIYSDSTVINAAASAIGTYTFDRWELNNHTILPSQTNPAGSFMLVQNDTLIAYFDSVFIPPHITLQVSVSPPYAGQAILNNITTVDFEYSEVFNGTTNINLKSIAGINYEFSHWEINNHFLMPDNFDEHVNFVMTQDEHVTAFFNPKEVLVFLPSSITPNEDAMNDVFTIIGASELDYCEVYVYSRWGQLIFSSRETTFAWDGTFKGELCPIDAYSYILIYSLLGSDKKHTMVGSVVLIY